MEKLASGAKAWKWIAMGTFAIVVAAVLWPLLSNPRTSLLSLGGDGVKNSYTYLWHTLYGVGTWFTGMNYPFGEHIVYTDGQPLLSLSFAALRPFLQLTFEDLQAIQHLLIISSIWLGMVFIYKILREYGTHPAFAILASVAIQLTSPQLLRISGHYALAYLCFVPMLFYWTLLYHRYGKLKHVGFVFLLLLTTTFLHPYYAMLGFIWCGLYSVLALFQNGKPTKSKCKKAAYLLLASGLVLLIFKAFLLATDPITDRPVEPLMVLPDLEIAVKEWFVSKLSRFWVVMYEIGVSGKIGNLEGNYLGTSTILLTMTAGVFYAFRKRIAFFKNTTSNIRFESIWLWMAFIILVISTDYPVYFLNKASIPFLGFVKQFRELDRAGWMAYYLLSIFAALFLYRLLVQLINQRRQFLIGFVLLPLVILSVLDANGYVIYIQNVLFPVQWNYQWFTGKLEEGSWNKFLKTKGYTEKDFSAILTLPFIHVGSEKLWVWHPEIEFWPFTLSDRASMQLRLPQMDVMMSRTSWSQTFEMVRLQGGPYADKSIFKRIQNQKPLLLLVAKNIGPNEDISYLIDAADSIGKFGQLLVYKLIPAKILELDRNAINKATSLSSGLVVGDTLLGEKLPFYINHFSQEEPYKRLPQLFGSFFNPTKAEKTEIANFHFAVDTASLEYEFSVWILLEKDNPRSPSFSMQQLDSKGEILWQGEIDTKYSTDNNGMWFRASRNVIISPACAQVSVTLVNDDKSTCLALDELQLRPFKTITVSKNKAGQVLINNHAITISTEK